ncbi:hypothetical protein WHR41_03425 [Cladosporium halotolerans]|uniref:WD40 repeat-like protein n=1 Tax=Cladosporium halotolerans TaxID=1052096 RepID=A0AB34KVL9_9PEZI
MASTKADQPRLELKFLASTDVNEQTAADGPQSAEPGEYEGNFFKEAQFSSDGTCIVSLNADNALRTFRLPQDLLDDIGKPHALSPWSVLKSPTNVQSYALPPCFDSRKPHLAQVLSAPREQPLRLSSALDASVTLAKYPYINPNNEAFQSPNSLLFSGNGDRFIAGSQGKIAIFETASPLRRPLLEHRTNPLDPHLAYTSMRDKGIIMSLAMSSQDVLAAGSTNRTVGLFPASGYGACETAFSVAPDPSDPDAAALHGTGITSLAWSADGTYLLVAERQSDGIHVYDVRYQRNRVAWLSGRNARTPQRLGISTVRRPTHFEVWAGGVDGVIRMWKDPGLYGGFQEPTAEFPESHGDAISSVAWHPSGAAMVSCSGQRHTVNDDGNDDLLRKADNSLKVWSI